MSAQNPNSPIVQTVEQILMTLKIVWGALLMSIFIYGFVASQRTHQDFVFNAAEAVPQNQIEMVMSVVALIMVVLAFVISGALINAAKKTITPQTDFKTVLQQFFTPFIIRLALLESCTIFGLVLSFTRGSIMIMLPFAVITIIGFLLSFPSETFIRGLMLSEGRSGPEII